MLVDLRVVIRNLKEIGAAILKKQRTATHATVMPPVKTADVLHPVK